MKILLLSMAKIELSRSKLGPKPISWSIYQMIATPITIDEKKKNENLDVCILISC